MLDDVNNLLCLSDETNIDKNITRSNDSSENGMPRKNKKEETHRDGSNFPLLIHDNQYRVKCYLAQLDEIQYILQPSRDVMNGVYSSNYGLVRPLLREIYQQGQYALPELIDYFDNENYLYSVTGHGNMPALAVGRITLGIEAKKLFNAIIDPTNANYKMRYGKDGELHVRPSFFYEKYSSKTIKEWYQKNCTKSLLEIQQETLDYYIQHEKKIGFPDKKSEQNYLVPLLELRNRLPVINSELFNNPPMPISNRNKTGQK
jgi:hypothetical protein